MEKAITYVGNSFAIVLDRTLCEVMGLGFGSIVKISFEGARMIVEHTGRMKQPPVRRRPRRAPSLRNRRLPESMADVRKPIYIPELDKDGEISLPLLRDQTSPIFLELATHWGLDLERINQIDCIASKHFVAAQVRWSTLRLAPGSVELVLARRLSFIYMELLDRTDWDRVIALALARYPFPSKDAMSAGNGAVATTVPPSG
jgi:hypothetical protein